MLVFANLDKKCDSYNVLNLSAKMLISGLHAKSLFDMIFSDKQADLSCHCDSADKVK
jgi:hypothetical protein